MDKAKRVRAAYGTARPLPAESTPAANMPLQGHMQGHMHVHHKVHQEVQADGAAENAQDLQAISTSPERASQAAAALVTMAFAEMQGHTRPSPRGCTTQ